MPSIAKNLVGGWEGGGDGKKESLDIGEEEARTRQREKWEKWVEGVSVNGTLA